MKHTTLLLCILACGSYQSYAMEFKQWTPKTRKRKIESELVRGDGQIIIRDETHEIIKKAKIIQQTQAIIYTPEPIHNNCLWKLDPETFSSYLNKANLDLQAKHEMRMFYWKFQSARDKKAKKCLMVKKQALNEDKTYNKYTSGLVLQCRHEQLSQLRTSIIATTKANNIN